MTLTDVAYVPLYMTNIVSVPCLMKRGVHWDSYSETLQHNRMPLYNVQQQQGHFVLRTTSLSINECRRNSSHPPSCYRTIGNTRQCSGTQLWATQVKKPPNNYNIMQKESILRLDGETSLGNEFIEMMRQEGITPERTVPYTHLRKMATLRGRGVC